jgi:hypothetical protein
MSLRVSKNRANFAHPILVIGVATQSPLAPKEARGFWNFNRNSTIVLRNNELASYLVDNQS